MNIDDKNNMNLNSEKYNSILCDQGELFNNQRNELMNSSKFNKNNDTNNNGLNRSNDTILINSSNNIEEGFTSNSPVVEGFHEHKESDLSSMIKNMDAWMKREFKELKVLQNEYSSMQSKYDTLDEKFGTEARDYLSRTTKDNSYNGKTLQFKDGEMGYVTEKGYLRDYDSDAHVQIGDKNKCNTDVVDSGITRSDFISLDSQKLGPKMLLNKSDIRTIRIYQKSNYLHVSEVEAYDGNDKSIIIPKNKKESVFIYCKVNVKLNDFSNNSDDYRMFLTYNGKKVSDDVVFQARRLPKITKGPPALWTGNYSNRFHRVDKGNGRGKQGMRIFYYTMKNCNGWSPRKLIGLAHHRGSINFNWGGGNIVDNYRDYVGTYMDGYIIAPISGSIRLYSDSDDGQAFYWAGRNLWYGLNLNHGRSDAGRYFANVQVVKGQYYKFQHLWRECGGGANVRLFWTLPGRGRQIIPAQYFTIGGTSSGAKRGVLYHKFKNVNSVVNGFEINTNGKKLVLEKPIDVWIRRDDQSWSLGGYYPSSKDSYGAIKVSNDIKVSFPSYNPFVESATMNVGVGWSGYTHYPIDGIISQKWPNAVHSAKNRECIYDINLRGTPEIERIRIRNRIDGAQNRLNGAKLQLLDGNKKLVKEYNLNSEQEQVFYLKNEPRGTTCGSEGKNVKVSNIGDIGNAEYIGCYRDKPSRAMKWEGKRGTFEQCKQYAIENKSPYFALQASKPNRDYHACMISDDLNRTMKFGKRSDERCPTRPYSKEYGQVGSGWTNAVYSLDKTNYQKVEEKSKNISDTIDTYTGGTIADCLNECEKTGQCNAIEYDPDFLTDVGEKDLYVGNNTTSNRTLRVSNKNVMKYFNMDAYEIVIKFRVMKNNASRWTCVYYCSSAGYLFLTTGFASNWQLYMYTHTSPGSARYFQIPRQFRKLNTTFTIRMVIETAKFKIKIYVNDILVIDENKPNLKVRKSNSNHVYIKPSWWGNTSNFKVESMILKDAYGEKATGKCETKTSQELTQANGSNTIIYNKLTERPFVHGKENLGKIGYVDEKGVLHEYPQNMTALKNNYSMLRDVDSPGNDIFNKVTQGIDEAKRIANSRSDIAGFVRLPNGRTWFKNTNMYPINPNGPQRFYRNMQLHHKETSFKQHTTCTGDYNEINSFEWNNYTKGQNMTMDTKCTISNYTDGKFNEKNNLATRLNELNQKIKEKIERIKNRNSRLNPYLEKSYKKIGDVVTETENNNNTRSELLGNGQEGMANMKDAYNNNISHNLPSYQEEQDSGSALLGLLGVAGLIMSVSYMKK